jgi:tRNA G10  N-methylase Trm11
MPKQYFLEAGNFQDLSFAELVSVFRAYSLDDNNLQRFSDNIFIIQNTHISEELIRNIFNRLGGFIRLGYVIGDIDTFLNEYIQKESKVVFGLSLLGQIGLSDKKFLKKLGFEIKKGLKEYNKPSRFVNPLSRSFALSAAQILGNDILHKGFELCIIKNKDREIYGCTLDIQDVEGFVMRDNEKPYTDLEMGTLPPKLARIMVNLTGLKEGILWDPFCGSGTVPMEASMLGFDILASDIDEKATFMTDENIKWLSQKGFITDTKYEIFGLDVTNPDKRTINKLKKTDISCVVCEPYMGPAQKRLVYPNRADVYLSRVKKLYIGLLDILEQISGKGFTIVLIIPSYKTFREWKTFSVREIFSKSWEILNTDISRGRDLKWSRKNSIITRNIFVLRKK